MGVNIDFLNKNITLGETSTRIMRFSTAPVNTVAPALSYTTLNIGDVITCSDDTWTGTAPITYTYQWYRDATPISGDTASSHTIVLADVGTTLKCVVTGTNAVGNASADSDTVPIIETYYDVYGSNEITVPLMIFKANDGSDYVLTGSDVDEWINKGLSNINATATANKPTKDGVGNWLNFASASAQKLTLQSPLELNCNTGFSMLVGFKQLTNDIYLLGGTEQAFSVFLRNTGIVIGFSSANSRICNYSGWDTKKTGRAILEFTHLGNGGTTVELRLNNGVVTNGSSGTPSINKTFFNLIGSNFTGTSMNGQIGFIYFQNKPFTADERTAIYNQYSSIYVPE